jgi:hypothetical protein
MMEVDQVSETLCLLNVRQAVDDVLIFLLCLFYFASKRSVVFIILKVSLCQKSLKSIFTSAFVPAVAMTILYR